MKLTWPEFSWPRAESIENVVKQNTAVIANPKICNLDRNQARGSKQAILWFASGQVGEGWDFMQVVTRNRRDFENFEPIYNRLHARPPSILRKATARARPEWR